MNIAPTDISAAARSARTGESRVAAGLRLLLASAVLAGAAVSLPAAAMGERDQRDRGDQQDAPRGQRERPQAPVREQPAPQVQQRGDRGQFDARAYDMRIEEARRQQAQQQQDTGARRGGRLSPDERRELRRQINEAGAEIYPNMPRR
jgi:hypothetical protein